MPGSNDDPFLQLAGMLNGLEQAVKTHRDIVFRAISQLNHEVIAFRDELDKDKAERAARQAQVDAKMQSIEDGQRHIRQWQWIRLGVEVGLILIALAYYFGGR